MQLTGDDGRTSATVTTDVALSGKVATMGQGVLQDVSGRLIDTFAKNLAAMLSGAEPAGAAAAAAPADGGAAAQAGDGGAAAPVGDSRAAAPAGDDATAAPTDGGATAPAAGEAAAPAGGGAAREPAPAAEALDLGSLGGQIIAERLQDPRRLGGLLALVALVAFLLGRRSAGG